MDTFPTDATVADPVRVLHQLAYTTYWLGDLQTALDEYRACLVDAEPAGLDHWIGVLTHDSALLYQDRGEYDRAIGLYRRSIDASTRAGDINHVAWSLFQLGVCRLDRGELDDARTLLEESDHIARTIGDIDHLSLTEHELDRRIRTLLETLVAKVRGSDDALG